MAEKKYIVYEYRGKIEIGNGKPGYDWHPGYSETSESGLISYPWMTRRECQQQARSQGCIARFKQ